MRKSKKLILIVALVAFLCGILFLFIKSRTGYNQDDVEKYVSKYSKDFTFLRKEGYSLGLDGFKESDEVDWYFHDNDLNFDFHVKTLRSAYSSKDEHIACNYYDAYVEKLINVKGKEIKKVVTDGFSEMYDNIEKYDIYYYNDTGQIRISIEGPRNNKIDKKRYSELSQIVSKDIHEVIEKYDSNLKNRNMKIGWDVDLNTDWSDTNKDLAIMVGNEIIYIKDYYNK